MQQLRDMWMMLDTRRRALVVGSLAALAIILLIVSRLAMTPSFALLYSGLDPASAGEIVGALESRGVTHQVRGDAIYVDQSRRDELRMSLAGEGLPAMGAAGYELLDTLSGFGTTSQMFDAAYWRAREGELARTILSSPRIRAARVHLATPGADPFRDAIAPSASVSIRAVSGGIGNAHAQALRHLVASAVPGLLPENVTVIDTDSGRVIGGEDMIPGSGGGDARAAELRRNIERLLSARVGAGNAVVEVSVTLNTAHETVVERRIDPESRIIIGTESEERATTTQDSGGAAVTVASNLPDGAAAAGGDAGSSSQNSETRQRVTYDVSEIQREIEHSPGTVQRITVAVLVNAVSSLGADGVRVTEPRSAEELASLQVLVESAIGHDATRGDLVTVQSMAFEPVADALADGEGAGSITDAIDLMALARLTALVLVTALIAFGVLRPAMKARERTGTQDDPQVAPASLPAALPRMSAAPTALAAPAADTAADDDTAPQPAVTTLPALASTASETRQGEDPVARLRRLIEEREEETVEILRSWMEEDEEPA